MKLIIDGITEEVDIGYMWRPFYSEWFTAYIIRNNEPVGSVQLPNQLQPGQLILSGSHQIRVPV